MAAMAQESATDLERRLAQAERELSEAREQQAATTEVLRVISSSPGELEPVFQTMLESAVRICEATFGTLYLCEGGGFRAVAMHNAPAAYAEARVAVVHPPPDTSLGQAANTKQAAQVVDVTKLQGYIQGNPFVVSAVKRGGYRTVLSVPMLKEDELIGAISIYRREVQPFTDKQIALVTSFANQAVIAIENTRLLNELRESLQQQTATSEVLQVISSSPGDLEPVFRAMLKNATRICGAKFGVLFRFEGGLFHPAALLDVPPGFADFLARQGSFAPEPGRLFGRLCQTRRVIQVDDRAAEPDPSPSARYGGARSSVAVPMLKGNELVGAFFIYRTEVRPFTDKQVELVQNFAAQAVIAIENTRLLNELRESLQQQTATSEVLQVISSSPGDLQPAFDAMLANATRLCEASYGILWLREGDQFRTGAFYGALPPAFTER
jgi:GAF domain-containing protein